MTEGRWLLVLFVTLAVLSMGGGLLALLALGMADPHPAGPLRWHTDTPHDWPLVDAGGNHTFLAAPTGLPAPPFTLDLHAANTGSPYSAWGLWIETESQPFIALIDNSGYVGLPDWQQFPHIQPDYTNRLTLDVGAVGQAVLRINDEIAWTGALAPGVSWGVILVDQPALRWHSINLYALD